jgi:prepilin-type N-terminal cleavage/methylation domain-containing protein
MSRLPQPDTSPPHKRSGVSLTEILCVLTILSILLGLYATATMRAWVRVKTFVESLQ